MTIQADLKVHCFQMFIQLLSYTLVMTAMPSVIPDNNEDLEPGMDVYMLKGGQKLGGCQYVVSLSVSCSVFKVWTCWFQSNCSMTYILFYSKLDLVKIK